MDGEWDDTNGTKATYWVLDPPEQGEEAPGQDGEKAFIKGIDCDPEYGWCPYEDMFCAGRYIEKVDDESPQYQKMVRVDPSFIQGETSYWCVTQDTLDLGMKWNGKFNDGWGV